MEIGEIKRPPPALIEAYRKVNSSTISNALDRLGLNGVMRNIKPVWSEFTLVGCAFTVWETTGELGAFPPEELRLGALIDALEPGDVAVIDNGGAPVSTFGGVAAVGAAARQAAGIVVDGAVRDIEQIRACGLPAFARHVVPMTGKGRIRFLAMNVAIRVDGILVRPGDIVVGDANGVVCVGADIAEKVLELALKQDESDNRTVELIRQGLSFSEAQRRAGVR
jgi:regulator of RNase E activity RraA